MITTLGNTELMQREKVAFFASSKTASLSVMPALDWATEVAKREDITVCSGFQSPLERDILPYLLRGKCGIIVALNRGLYKKIPEQYRVAYRLGRILFVSLQSEKTTRPSRAAAERRNQYLADIADSLVFASLTPQSSLYQHETKTDKPTTKI